MLFSLLKDVVTGTVKLAGEVTKVTVDIGLGVTAGVTAGVLGKEHAAAKAVTEVAEGLSKGTAFLVDRAAVPLASAIGRGTVKSVERVYDLGAGVAEATLTDRKEEGWARAAKAAAGIATVAVVGVGIGVVAEGLIDAVDGIDLDVDVDSDLDLHHDAIVERATPDLHHVDAHWVEGHYRGDTWVEGYWRDGDGDTGINTSGGYWRGTPKA